MATLEELLVSIGINTDDLTGGAQGAADSVESSLGGIGAAAAGAAVGGLFAAGLSSAMDIAAARSSLRDQLDLTEAEAARAGDVAGDVFSAGFGGSLEEVTESVAGVASSIGELGEFTDAEMESMSKSALGFADRFKVDVTDATGAVGQLMKTGLVSDATEGFDLITKAMSGIPKELRDDLLPTVQEYSTQFRRVGLDGATAFGLISQAVANGARDLDQVADAIGQFGERALAGGAPVEDAFKSIGLDADEMAAKIGKGGDSAEAALQMTMDALRGAGDEQTKLNAAAALFGDPANVMGDALFALDPATAAASSGLDDAAGAAGKMTDAMEADPAQQMDAAMRTFQQTLGEALLPPLLLVAGVMAEHQGLMKVLAPIVLGLALAIGIAVIAQWAWNTALWAFPGTWIIAGIIALIAIIVLIVVYWDEIAAATGRVWDWIVGKLGTAWQWIKDAVAAAWNWVVQKTTAAWDWVVADISKAISDVMAIVNWLAAIPGKVAGWFGQVVSWIGGLPAKISSAASGMWDGISSSFRSMVNQLISGWNNLSFTIGGGSIMGVSIPSLTLHTPNIPMLAEGGITTGATLAMIGEGTEQEAVLPLSKLDSMLNAPRGVGRAGGGPVVLEIRSSGSDVDDFLVERLRKAVRVDGGGDVQVLLGSR